MGGAHLLLHVHVRQEGVLAPGWLLGVLHFLQEPTCDTPLHHEMAVRAWFGVQGVTMQSAQGTVHAAMRPSKEAVLPPVKDIPAKLVFLVPF